MLVAIADFEVALKQATICYGLSFSKCIYVAMDDVVSGEAIWMFFQRNEGVAVFGATLRFEDRRFIDALISAIYEKWVQSGKFTQQAHEFKQAVDCMFTEASLTRSI